MTKQTTVRIPDDLGGGSEVVAPEGLSWLEAASGMHTITTLSDLGDTSTEIVIHQRQVSEPMRAPAARAGFLTSLEKLDEYLTRLIQKEQP